MNLSTLVRRLSLIVLCVAKLAVADEVFKTRWELSEHQLNIDRGGRVNSIAVHPDNPNEMFVASETGGLFKTTNGGQKWTHVDGLPVIFTQSVVYQPSQPDTLFVSAKADFKVNNGGGVWRSLDKGETWHPMTLTVPNFTGRLSAYGMAVTAGNDRIVVGTSQGIFASLNGGASWTYSDVFGETNPDIDKTVYSAVIENNQVRVIVGGPAGVRIGTLPLPTTWQSPAVPPGNSGVHDIHALEKTPLAASPARQLFVVNGATELFRSGDGGLTWIRIPNAPLGGSGCGGTSFVRVGFFNLTSGGFFRVYLGNRCRLHRLQAPISTSDNMTTNYGGMWVQATQLEGNPRDLAQFGNVPVLLGSTFGLHKTVTGSQEGMIWNLAGNGRVINDVGGYNALQITEVRGQIVGPKHSKSTHLYIGTQDNKIWSASPLANVGPSLDGNAFFIEMDRNIESTGESEITFAPGNPTPVFTRHHLATPMPWNNPQGADGKPAFVRRSAPLPQRGQWVQQVRQPENAIDGLATTEDSGLNWRPFAVFTQEPRDIPKVGRPGDAGGNTAEERTTVLYQAFRGNGLFGRDPRPNKLMRIERDLALQDATVMFPLMEGFQGLGINPTMFAWYQVFGVDPGNADHLIAPDVIGGDVRRSTTGGHLWFQVPNLTNYVTAGTTLGGPLLFRTDLSGGRTGEVFPIITAVSFCPVDPRLVLVGTSEGGIFFSDDNGVTWKPNRVPNSDKATYITSFFWESANTVFVSTYGRGLWRIHNKRIAVNQIFDETCVGCEVLPLEPGPTRPPSVGGVLTFDGNMHGVRTENGRLREVFITPGASVLFTGDLDDPQDDIAVTESDGRDTSEFTPLPKPPDGWILTGVVFEKEDVLTGAAYAASELSVLPPVAAEAFKGSTDSPTAGNPYIRLSSADYNGVATVGPSEMLDITATDFAAGTKYELLIDGEPLKGDVTADGKGSFTTRIPAPSQVGYHRVEVRAVGDEVVLDASELVVR